MEKKLPEQIEFGFEYEPTYRLVPSNGVWGGVTSRGDIRADFFVESPEVPQSITNKVLDAKTLGEEVARVPEGRKFIRRLQFGVMLTPDHAEVIGKWLIDKAEEFREKTKLVKNHESST